MNVTVLKSHMTVLCQLAHKQLDVVDALLLHFDCFGNSHNFVTNSHISDCVGQHNSSFHSVSATNEVIDAFISRLCFGNIVANRLSVNLLVTVLITTTELGFRNCLFNSVVDSFQLGQSTMNCHLFLVHYNSSY